MMIRKTTGQGAMIPAWGYGVAWDTWKGSNVEVVWYPIPLNIIMGRLRLIWLLLKQGQYSKRDIQMLHDPSSPIYGAGQAFWNMKIEIADHRNEIRLLRDEIEALKK